MSAVLSDGGGEVRYQGEGGDRYRWGGGSWLWWGGDSQSAEAVQLVSNLVYNVGAVEAALMRAGGTCNVQ